MSFQFYRDIVRTVGNTIVSYKDWKLYSENWLKIILIFIVDREV